MDKINEAFRTLAQKMHLHSFFKGETLVVNNLFLLVVILFLLICLLLVIFLVPSKKKRKQKKAAKAAAAAAKDGEQAEEQGEEASDEAASEETAEEAPAPAPEEPAEESAPEEAAPAGEPAPEEPAEESAPEEAAPAGEPAPVEPEAPHEEKEVLADDASDEDASAKKNSGKYEIVKRYGSFYFLLKANNGQLLLESTGYTTEQGAKKAIDTFKNAVEVGEFSIDEDKNGNFKFILRASARSQMLYHGETYASRQRAESAIQSVKNFALTDTIRRVTSQDQDAAVVEIKPLAASDHKFGGKYEIEERDGSFFFLLKANNGQLLLESPAFTTEQGAKGGIDSFKKAADSGVYVIDEDKNGNFRFILRASTRSQMRYFGESYSTRQSAENSVNSVRAFAQNAVLK